MLEANDAATRLLDGAPFRGLLQEQLGLTTLPPSDQRVTTRPPANPHRVLEVVRGPPVHSRPPSSLVVLHDITERARSERRWQHAVVASSDGVWDWDVVSGHVYFSPRWMEMVGYGPTELPHHFDTFITLMHPDDLGRVNPRPPHVPLQDRATVGAAPKRRRGRPVVRGGKRRPRRCP